MCTALPKAKSSRVCSAKEKISVHEYIAARGNLGYVRMLAQRQCNAMNE